MTTANARELRDQWDSVRRLVKERWEHLTDEDLRILENNVEQFVSIVQQKTGEAREAIEAFLAGVIATASRYAHHAGDRLRERFDRAEHLVRDRPGQSVAAAFGCGLAVGLVVGLMIRPR